MKGDFMNLSKAIKKQRKNYIGFLVFMGFTFILLPVVLILFKNYNVIVWTYLIVIEVFVSIITINRVDYETLRFKHKVDKFYIRNGILRRHIYFKCESLVFVHLERKDEKEELVLLFQSKRSNRNLKGITKMFMKKYPYVSSYYYDLYKLKPEYYYYYLVINKGWNKKYLLLDELYSSCFNAFYSEEAIEIIKQCRE